MEDRDILAIERIKEEIAGNLGRRRTVLQLVEFLTSSNFIIHLDKV